MAKKINYEARLKRNVSRISFGKKTIYKKGTLIWSFPEKIFNKITAKNISRYTSLSICEGHGIFKYFNLDKDIEFVKIEVVTSKKEKIVKLKS